MEIRLWPDEWYDRPAEPEPPPLNRGGGPRGPRVKTRFEFRSFERYIQLNYTDTDIRRSEQKGGGEIAAGFIAELLGMSRHNVDAYRRRGVSHLQADRICIKLDIHPALIWPDWWGEEINQTEGATHE